MRRRVIARRMARRRLLDWTPRYADARVETHYLRYLLRVSHAYARLIQQAGLSEDASAEDLIVAQLEGRDGGEVERWLSVMRRGRRNLRPTDHRGIRVSGDQGGTR